MTDKKISNQPTTAYGIKQQTNNINNSVLALYLGTSKVWTILEYSLPRTKHLTLMRKRELCSDQLEGNGKSRRRDTPSETIKVSRSFYAYYKGKTCKAVRAGI